MKNKNIAILAIANFITAFGGGAILGKGMGVVSFPFAEMGSLVAFFFGTAFGLFLLYTFLGNHHHRNDLLIALLGAICSVCLLLLFQNFSNISGKLEGWIGGIFFILLSLRFSFWFLSRILRSDRMSSESPKAVPFIEGSFHTGTITSLVAIALGVLSLDLAGVLVLDICSQLIGCFLDLFTKRFTSKADENIVSTKETEETPKSYNKIRLVSAITVFSITTVMIQVVLFHIAHLTSHQIGAAILAAFYSGLAVAGFIGARYGITFVKRGYFGSTGMGLKRKLIFQNWFFIIGSALSVLLVILFQEKSADIFLVVLLTFLSSVIYEIFEFSLLDVISEEGRIGGFQRIVAKTFGIMAITACISMFFLGLFNLNLKQSAVFVCLLFVVTFFFVRRVNVVKQSSGSDFKIYAESQAE